jgi:hypothetical protein
LPSPGADSLSLSAEAEASRAGNIARDFFIAPGEERPIDFQTHVGDVQEAMKKLDSEECTYSLRLSYDDSFGTLKHGRYPFGGFGKNGSLILMMPLGETLI